MLGAGSCLLGAQCPQRRAEQGCVVLVSLCTVPDSAEVVVLLSWSRHLPSPSRSACQARHGWMRRRAPRRAGSQPNGVLRSV